MIYDKQFRPVMGHWSPNTFITDRGHLGATLHVAGVNFELLDEAGTRMCRDVENQLSLATGNDRLEWVRHFVRVSGQKAPPLPECHTWWAKEFDHDIQTKCVTNLYRNELFFTVMLRPQRLSFLNMTRYPVATKLFEEEFEDLIGKTLSHLRMFQPRRLGFRQDANYGWCSEIAEAHHLIGSGRFRPIPLPAGTERLGRQILPVRPIFGHRDGELLTEGRKTHFAVFGFSNYPAATHPSMFEALKNAPFDFTLTNHYEHKGITKALKELEGKQRWMASGGDSKRQQGKLADKQEDLKDAAEGYGTHCMSLAVRAQSLEDLDKFAAVAEDLVAKGRATVVRYDSKALPAAFYSQFPGNAKWRVRRGGTSSVNFASYGALNNVPRCAPTSRWGAPIVHLKTSKDTLYPYHFHVTGDPTIRAEDVASWTSVGGMGTGKTSWNAQTLILGQRVGARSIVIDKDCGLAAAVLANDGVYFVLEDGVPTGINPLKGLTDRPDDIEHLKQFLLGLIESDDRGPITTVEENALAHQVAFQMSMPPHMRSIDGIWPMLPGHEEGAGARLRKWGRDQHMGWAFDGPTDDMCLTSHMIGYDTTALLKNVAVCEPMLHHLFYRFQSIIYQRKPLLIFVDESWQTIGENPGAVVDLKRFQHGFQDYSRTIRKNEGAIGLATQDGGSLLKSSMADSIRHNFPTKHWFGDRNADRDVMIDGHGLTPKEFEIVRDRLPAMPGAMLVKRPDSSFIAVNDLSALPNRLAVLSGRRATYDLIRLLQDARGLESKLWVPEYERLAPMIVKNPKLDPHELVHGRRLELAA